LYGCGIPFNVIRSSNYEEMKDENITYGLIYVLLNWSKYYKISFFFNAHKQPNMEKQFTSYRAMERLFQI
jgi:hypothetical protein